MPKNKPCSVCGGLKVLLGRLGRRLHYRCRDCGILSSVYRPLRKPKALYH